MTTFSISQFLQNTLEKQDISYKDQQALWKELDLCENLEIYRKIFFEDYVTKDYLIYEQIALALKLDPVQLQALAYANNAPINIRNSLIQRYSSDSFEKNHYDYAKPFSWTRDSLKLYLKNLYQIEGFDCTVDYLIDDIRCDIWCEQKSRVTPLTRHVIWVVIPNMGNILTEDDLNPVLDKAVSYTQHPNPPEKFRIVYVGKLGSVPDIHQYIDLLSLEDFTKQFFSSGQQYLMRLYKEWSTSDICQAFTPLKVSFQVKNGINQLDFKNEISQVDFLSDWLSSDSSLCVIHGPFGAGKTTLVDDFCYRQGEAVMSLPTSAWFPLRIQMRDYKNARWTELIKEVIPRFLEKELGLAKSRETWQSFLANGPFVLIFDALDEYEISFSEEERDEAVRQFKSMLEMLGIGQFIPTKVIITLRSEMFPSHVTMTKFFMDISPRVWIGAMVSLGNKERITLLKNRLSLRLRKNESEIDNIDEKAADIANRVVKIIRSANRDEDGNDGNDPLAKPLFIEMIAQHWSELSRMDKISVFDLHEMIVEGWLRREEVEKRRTTLDVKLKRRFLFYLASRYELEGSVGTRLNYKDLPEDICSFLCGTPDPSQLDIAYEHEVRVSSFLERDIEGNYSFRHHSFAQFCSAMAIKEEISKGSIQHLKRQFEPSSKPEEQYLFGLNNMNVRASNLFVEFVHKFNNRVWENTLFSWLKATRDNNYNKFNGNCFVSANAFYMLVIATKGCLSHMDRDWRGLYLSDIFIRNSSKGLRRESGCILLLNNIDFRGTLFTRCSFENVDMRGTDLSSCWFHDCNFENITVNEETNIDNIIVTGNETKGSFFKNLEARLKEDNGIAMNELMEQRIVRITPEKFVYIPGGNYKIGLDDSHNDTHLNNAYPSVEVTIDPFFMQLSHVTNEEFFEFARTTSSTLPQVTKGLAWDNIEFVEKEFEISYYLYHWNTSRNEPHLGSSSDSPGGAPVVWVNFYAAWEYAETKNARLPSECEYEIARTLADVEDLLKETLETSRSVSIQWNNQGCKPPKNIKEAFVVRVKDWCLDEPSPNHAHRKMRSINPLTSTASITNYGLSKTASTGKRRVVKGCGLKIYKPPQYRETMLISNVNIDMGFRTVREVWHVLSDSITLEDF